MLQTQSPDGFSAALLFKMSKSVYLSCLQTLGSSSNKYTADQLEALTVMANVNYDLFFFKIELE